MIDAICKEIKLRESYLTDKNLKSIYFGGGTPSLLDENDLQKIFTALSNHFHWSNETEITLEANPDDLSLSKLSSMQRMGINRLSIGVQSFFNEDLLWMNRAHNADEARTCIKTAQDIGMENITIDLIYGSPVTTFAMWETNVNQAIALDIPHISAYCLTVEEKTALSHQVKTKKTPAPNPELSNEQFIFLIDKLQSGGFDHYEISNFGKPGHYAVHNTNYWKGAHYLGIGPSAHSYDGVSRSWNIAHNKKYIDSILNDILPLERELLSSSTRYNEYIMTGLRTMWGVGLTEIQSFGAEYGDSFIKMIANYIQSGLVTKIDDRYYLTQDGKFFADSIASDLFYV